MDEPAAAPEPDQRFLSSFDEGVAHLAGLTVASQPSCWLAPSLIGRCSDGKGGHGVFARRPIERGELLAVFGGSVVSAEFLRVADPALRRLTLQIDEDLFVISTVEGPADWFNHSCEPNAGLQGQLSLVAMRTIAAGEEVCYDYAMSDGSAYDEFHCACGARRCRGRVTGQDWQLPELWARYGDHFSPYLIARIDRLRQMPAWSATRKSTRRARTHA